MANIDGIEGFEEVTPLGRGGVGDVYRARRASTGGLVAIKVLRDWNDVESGWRRSERELAALLRLKGHPHVVHVEEIIWVEGTPALVMEYAPGGTVASLVSQRGTPLDVTEVVLVGTHVASALHEGHALGIAHLDVKPHNMLIGAFGQVKLCDYGIAALTQSPEFRDRTMALSLRYASPEQIVGVGHVGIESDVYSLASSLVHILTGASVPPRTAESDGGPALLTWEPPEWLDPQAARLLTDTLRRCLAVSPVGRPTAAEVEGVMDSIASSLGARRVSRLVPLSDDVTIIRPVERRPGTATAPTDLARLSPRPGSVDDELTTPRHRATRDLRVEETSSLTVQRSLSADSRVSDPPTTDTHAPTVRREPRRLPDVDSPTVLRGARPVVAEDAAPVKVRTGRGRLGTLAAVAVIAVAGVVGALVLTGRGDDVDTSVDTTASTSADRGPEDEADLSPQPSIPPDVSEPEAVANSFTAYYECVEGFDDAVERAQCFSDGIAAGTIDAYFVSPQELFPQCGLAEFYENGFADYSSLIDADFIALHAEAQTCFEDLVASGEIDADVGVPLSLRDISCYEGRNPEAIVDVDERFDVQGEIFDCLLAAD